MTWEKLRESVIEKTTGRDIMEKIFNKVTSVSESNLLAVKPSFYLGHLYTVALDYVESVEHLLKLPDQDRNGVLRSILFVRECVNLLASGIKALAVPLESLILSLDEEYDEKAPAKDEGVEEGKEDHREQFEEERKSLEERIRVKLRSVNLGEQIVDQVAEKISDLYVEAVLLASQLGNLLKVKEGGLEEVLTLLMELQYGAEWQMACVIEEEMATDGEITVEPGIMTWTSHLLHELMAEMGEKEMAQAGKRSL